jgi:hypothetical protein
VPLLWNLQTQSPQFFEPDAVSAALASGNFRTYEGSQSVRSASADVEPGVDPGYQVNELDQAELYRLEAGAQQVGPGELLAKQAEEKRREELDTLGHELLAFSGGVVSGVTAGLVDPREISPELDEISTINPWAAGAGVATGIVVPGLLSGGTGAAASAARATPAGAIARGAARVAEKVGGSVVAREAAAGAFESTAYAVGGQIGGALWGDTPVSAEAVVSEMGLGALIGGGLGAVARGARTSVEAMDAAKKSGQVIPDLLNPASDLSRGVDNELRSAGGSWDKAVEHYRAQLDVLDAAQRRGEIPGSLDGFLEERYVAHRQADMARRKLLQVLGGNKNGDPWERLEKVLLTGKPKRVQEVAEAMDSYGAAVARLDDAMAPRDLERALSPTPRPLGSPGAPPPGAPVRGAEAAGPKTNPGKMAARADDSMVPWEPPPLNQTQTMVPWDPPPATQPSMIPWEPPVTRVTPGGTRVGMDRPMPGTPTVRLPAAAAAAPPAAPAAARAADIPVMENPGYLPTTPLPGRGTAATGDMAPPAGPALGGVQIPRGNAVADFVAAPRIAPGPRPTDLGALIQQRLAAIDELVGNQAVSAGALDMAEQLGIDLARVSGPVAERAVQIWGLRKMAEAAMKAAKGSSSKSVGAAENLLERAVGVGVGRVAGGVGRAMAGPFGGGVASALGSGAVRLGLKFAGQVGTAAAKAKENVTRAVDAALAGGKRVRPVGRAATALRVSYDPEVEGDARGTRDFRIKADQLRALAGNEAALRAHVTNATAEVAKMDPHFAKAIQDVAVNRISKLAMRLPAFLAHGNPLVDPKKAPLDVKAVREWELYEAITYNPALAWKFVASGAVPGVVAEALREQHPEMFMEMTKQVLSDPERLKRADQATLKGLSTLLGIPLIPAADPAFRARQQARFAEKRQASQDVQRRQQGAAALRGGLHGQPVPTPGQAAAQGPIGNR